jgi:hypothetical protein
MQIKLLTCLALLLAGCGDDNNDLGASGVVSGKVVAELSQAEQRKLCNWVAAQQYTLPIRSECEGDATLSWSTQAECESARDDCIASAPADRAEEMQYGRDSCADEGNARAACKAKVAEIETCLNDVMAAQRAFYGALTCDMVDKDIDDNVPEPPSCKGIDLACDF